MAAGLLAIRLDASERVRGSRMIGLALGSWLATRGPRPGVPEAEGLAPG